MNNNISINVNPRTYGSINSYKYFNLISQDQLSEQEQESVDKFEKLMKESERYRDYLVGSLKTNKDLYENKMSNLIMMQEVNPEVRLTDNERRAIQAYNEQKTNVLKFNEEKVKKLAKSKDVSYGYTNSASLIFSTLATGILIGVVMFLMK